MKRPKRKAKAARRKRARQPSHFADLGLSYASPFRDPFLDWNTGETKPVPLDEERIREIVRDEIERAHQPPVISNGSGKAFREQVNIAFARVWREIQRHERRRA